MKWKVMGYDTFEGGNAYYPISEHDTEEQAKAAAREKLKELEKSQPSSSSGGQFFGGIQDRIYVISPTGARTRIMS